MVTTATVRPTKSAKASGTYHHGDLRNALIREGRRLLEERGAAELSLRETARGVGVSEAAPSRHFKGKEGLLAAIASEGFRELAAQRLAVAQTDLSTLQQAREMMHIYVRYAQDNKGVFNLMMGPRILETPQYGELVETTTTSFNLFSDTLVKLAREQGWPRKQLELVAHAAWAVEHGLATLVLINRAPRPDRHLALDAMIDFAIELLLSGVTAGPAAMAQVIKALARGKRVRQSLP